MCGWDWAGGVLVDEGVSADCDILAIVVGAVDMYRYN